MEAKDLMTLSWWQERTLWIRDRLVRLVYVVPIHVCSCCGRRTYRWKELLPHLVGVQNDAFGAPRLVLWNCPRCRSTKAVCYGRVPVFLRLAAWEAQQVDPVFREVAG